jgi:hypothetical protein
MNTRPNRFRISAGRPQPEWPQAPGALAVVAHDAGAANVILPWLDDQPGARVFMQGPAAQLWNRRFPDRALCGTLEQAVQDAQLVLTGTGWASTLEHDARVMAARQGQRHVAVLDHWTNYAQRFERAGITQWPDEFWVTDEHARDIAAQLFPSERVHLFENLYMAEQVQAIGPPPTQGDVLYVLEPLHALPARQVCGNGAAQAGEFQALDFFMRHREVLGLKTATPVRLRPHPSDPPGKYGEWLQSTRGQGARIDAHHDLIEAMKPASWVVGAQTMAMVVALRSGRNVVSSLPPWAPRLQLPHASILSLRDMVSKSARRQGGESGRS